MKRPSLKIAELVDDAVAKGGKLLLGGQRLNRPGYYYPPTVLADVPDNADMIREEIFRTGGLAAILRPTKPKRSARPTTPSMAWRAYVYTQDLKRGIQICEKIEAGMIGLNRGIMSDPAAPFGGVKASGLGREGSHHGLIEFCEAKYVSRLSGSNFYRHRPPLFASSATKGCARSWPGANRHLSQRKAPG